MTYACPKCSCTRFDIAVMQTASVSFYTDDDEFTVLDVSGDTEFGDDDPATCLGCGYNDLLGNMHTKEQVESAELAVRDAEIERLKYQVARHLELQGVLS